jgi:hypothetical protein
MYDTSSTRARDEKCIQTSVCIVTGKDCLKYLGIVGYVYTDFKYIWCFLNVQNRTYSLRFEYIRVSSVERTPLVSLVLEFPDVYI